MRLGTSGSGKGSFDWRCAGGRKAKEIGSAGLKPISPQGSLLCCPRRQGQLSREHRSPPWTWGPCFYHISPEILGSTLQGATCGSTSWPLAWLASYATSFKAGDAASGPALGPTISTEYCLLVNSLVHVCGDTESGKGWRGWNGKPA